MLGSLCRTLPRELTFLRILPTGAAAAEERAARRELERVARDESPSPPAVEVLRGDDLVAVLADQAAANDLLVLGLPRPHRHTVQGGPAPRAAGRVDCSVILLSRGV